MSEKSQDPFSQRVDRMFDALDQAFKQNKAAILIGIYHNNAVEIEAEMMLIDKLRAVGHEMLAYLVRSEYTGDISTHMARHPTPGAQVFLISFLSKGGGRDGKAVYRALNQRFNLIVRNHIKCVIWVTGQEARMLEEYAPRFWQARTRAVEFVEPPGFAEHGGAATFSTRPWETDDPDENTDEKIKLREMLLRNVPDVSETVGSRMGLQFTLGQLYWSKRELDKAHRFFKDALKTAQAQDETMPIALMHSGLATYEDWLGHTNEALSGFHKAIELQPDFPMHYTALGMVYRRLERYDEAAAVFQKAIAVDPQFGQAYNGLGLIYICQHRFEEAWAQFEQAVEVEPTLAYPHYNFGFLKLRCGDYEGAIESFKRLIEMDDKDVSGKVTLAGVYRRQGREAECKEQLALAREGVSRSREYDHACFESVSGNVDRAFLYLKRAIYKQESPRHAIRLDPDMDFIRDDPRFMALVGTDA